MKLLAAVLVFFALVIGLAVVTIRLSAGEKIPASDTLLTAQSQNRAKILKAKAISLSEIKRDLECADRYCKRADPGAYERIRKERAQHFDEILASIPPSK